LVGDVEPGSTRIDGEAAREGYVAGEGWATSVFASHAFVMSELPETLKVGAGPCRPEESGELVRLDFDIFDGVPALGELVALLAREIEPFIIGVGEVLVYETPKGLKVILLDGGKTDRSHKTSARCVVTNDTFLLAALRELRDRLSAVDVPEGVVKTFPSLSDLQDNFSRLYSYRRSILP
jgi:hypothetical protein